MTIRRTDGPGRKTDVLYFREQRLRIIRLNSPIIVMRYFFERLLCRPNTVMPELIKVDKQIEY